jgi:hypothetical protein
MSEPHKPMRKFSDIVGTIPQWLSAAAALGILYMTITGLKAAKPILENAALREENAQLRLDTGKNLALLNQAKQAVAQQTANSWRYVCDHYTAKARAAASPNFILAGFDAGEVQRLKQSYPVLAIGTGAELLRSADIRDDMEMLSPAEQKRFAQMVDAFINDSGPVMTAFIQTGPAADAPAEVTRARQARQAFDQAIQKFLTPCNAAAPAP